MNAVRHAHSVRAAAVLIAAGLALTGCAKAESAGSSGGGGSSDAASAASAASSQPADSGSGCTLEQYGAKKIDLKNATVGFSQSEPETAPFRVAETESIKDEAKKVGVKKLLTTNANSQLSKQIADIEGMINQGAELLIVAPLNSDGLQPAFAAAKKKNIPVITIDRKVNAKPCKDYLTFLGSDFVEQGKRAADALAKASDKKGNIAILLGASGNNVTTDRTKGFVDEIKKAAPDMKIIAKQTGNFERQKGQQVMATLLQANPSIDAVYAENDEMGLGAIVAISAAGKKPGKDIKIVSVDGTKAAVQALANGKYNGVIESNPRFGPLAFDTAKKFYAGDPIPANIIISDNEYTPENAKKSLNQAF